MGPRLSAFGGVVLALEAIRRVQQADYIWAALGFVVALGLALRAYKLWEREHT